MGAKCSNKVGTYFLVGIFSHTAGACVQQTVVQTRRLLFTLAVVVAIQVDIYSFGTILWELITGDSPQRGRMRAIKCVSQFSQRMMVLLLHAKPSFEVCLI